MSAIHVIHENPQWTEPLFAALADMALPYRDWDMSQGAVDLDREPPEGVFYNRMSASSHTRGHRYAPEYTAALLAWLESHGRRVLNPGRALALEINKAAQYGALRAHGIRLPRTVVAQDRASLLAAARTFPTPFITKHNRAGKGLGVRRFDDPAALAAYLDGPDFEPPVDGLTLLQAYIQAPEPIITRVEFIGRELLYAVEVDTSRGFELCPADVCEVPAAPRESFRVLGDFHHPLVARYRRLMDERGLDVAAFEFIRDGQGRDYTYDINTNTNYNGAAEARAGISGMRRLAAYLGEELRRLESPAQSMVRC